MSITQELVTYASQKCGGTTHALIVAITKLVDAAPTFILALSHPQTAVRYCRLHMETSSQEDLTAIEQRIASDKLAKFTGAARVSIQHLEFQYPTRQIDRKAIRQLIRDFDGEGYIREEPSHRIPVIVDNSILQAALEKLSLTTEIFRAKADNPPFLELESGVKLECLHGQHRIVAAQEHLAPSQWWWAVDIYGTGSSTPSNK